MTGYGRDEDREAARAAGFDLHMVKSANLGQLQELLANGRSNSNRGEQFGDSHRA
jgi:CheY-like chemotaxis protein